jgi:hypothetical protein
VEGRCAPAAEAAVIAGFETAPRTFYQLFIPIPLCNKIILLEHEVNSFVDSNMNKGEPMEEKRGSDQRIGNLTIKINAKKKDNHSIESFFIEE